MRKNVVYSGERYEVKRKTSFCLGRNRQGSTDVQQGLDGMDADLPTGGLFTFPSNFCVRVFSIPTKSPLKPRALCVRQYYYLKRRSRASDACAEVPLSVRVSLHFAFLGGVRTLEHGQDFVSFLCLPFATIHASSAPQSLSNGVCLTPECDRSFVKIPMLIAPRSGTNTLGYPKGSCAGERLAFTRATRSPSTKAHRKCVRWLAVHVGIFSNDLFQRPLRYVDVLGRAIPDRAPNDIRSSLLGWSNCVQGGYDRYLTPGRLTGH